MILHVISGLGMGGAERNLFQLADSLHEGGVPQHIVSLVDGGVWGERFSERGIPLTTLSVRRSRDVMRGLWQLGRIVRQERPNIIQGWMYHGDLFAAVAHRFSPGRKRRALFWNLRASNMDAGGYGPIITVNARLSRWPDVLVANSQAGLDLHLRRGYRPRKALVIPNGIDTSLFRPDLEARAAIRKSFGLSDDDLVAVHVARVDPMKGHDHFLRAMARLPQMIGLMAGKGTDKLQTPANVIGLGLHREPHRLYAAADVIVSTSLYGEGFSNVLAEGMSCGLIPVATDVGDARKILGDAGAVLSARLGEMLEAELVDVLTRIGRLATHERQSLGAAARSQIVEHFSLAGAVESYRCLYRC